MRLLLCVCVLSLFAYPGFVNSWDLAITVQGQIEFFNLNGSRAGIASQQFSDLTALTYDSVYQTLYFADTQHLNATIFSFHLTENKDIEHLVSKSNSHNVQGIAFDPVSGILFWTDWNNKSIFWASLVAGSDTEGRGTVLLKLEDEVPQGIAVDSCRGMIYWTNANSTKPSIERATIEGTNREIIIEGDLSRPIGITLDQGSKKIFWNDNKDDHYRLESADLDGSHRQVIFHGSNNQPYNIAIMKDFIYWTDWVYKSVWKLPLDRTNNVGPVVFKAFANDAPMGIVSRVNILEQIEGKPECKILEETILNRTNHLEYQMNQADQDVGIVTNIQTPQYVVKYCLNGGSLKQSKDDAMNGNKVCNCPRGFVGYRCETMLCHNYCFYGSCLLNNEGFPTCRCLKGFRGKRCHESICSAFCLNDGICNVTVSNQPSCRCPMGWKGERCELKEVEIITTPVSCSCPDQDSNRVDSGTNSTIIHVETQTEQSDVGAANRVETSKIVNVESQNDLLDENNSSFVQPRIVSGNELFMEASECVNWRMREPVVMGLSVLCFILAVTTALSGLKIVLLRRRPRIRKRIIVNKNVTPLTCRPNPPQCEITIENCCNMNICETPCFEPEGLREQLHDSAKKEEKKNLLMNIEHPDDMY